MKATIECPICFRKKMSINDTNVFKCNHCNTEMYDKDRYELMI